MTKADDERKKRLAATLRQNLHRRKAQARGDMAGEEHKPEAMPNRGDE